MTRARELPACLRPPARDAHLQHQNAPEADECPCADCNPPPSEEGNPDVND